MSALLELDEQYRAARKDSAFKAELKELLETYAGRPTPLFFARRLTQKYKGARIFLKREDLAHTGAHKINNCLGQALLAQRMGKKRIIAETGAGQHGVAVATVASLFGCQCTVYMGFAHAFTESGSRSREFRQPHAERRHQPGHPRLGHQRSFDALYHRFNRRSPSVPADRA